MLVISAGAPLCVLGLLQLHEGCCCAVQSSPRCACRCAGVMAGWFSFTLSQVVLTSVTMGALKHSGALQCVIRSTALHCSKYMRAARLALICLALSIVLHVLQVRSLTS